MGIPSFFRWLVERYPKIVVNVDVEEEEDGINNVDSPKKNEDDVDSRKYRYHNLYLDMNGIIHQCFHPEDDEVQIFPPTTYDQVFKLMFDYVDRIIRIVRPTNLLFIAIDGVAPRAKMNHQRARRFKAAEEAQLKEEEERLRREFAKQGKEILPKQQQQQQELIRQVWDSNIITPGTIFMDKLSKALQYYIRQRLNMNHPHWRRDLKVILSDSNVPGEGEHKIMSFIRLQRGLQGYNPNTRHCLYGADADLIMLALASHEVHFSILREDALKKAAADCSKEISISSLETNLSAAEYSKISSRTWFTKVKEKTHDDDDDDDKKRRPPLKPYQLVNMWTLREYLQLEFTIPNAPFHIDIDRVIDDFVFMSFLTGNDFIPNLPSIDIRECALDMLVHVYKMEFRTMGGYIVDTTRIMEGKAAYVKAKRFEKLLRGVSRYEQKIFEKRQRIRQFQLRRFMRERRIIIRLGNENVILFLQETPPSQVSSSKEELSGDVAAVLEARMQDMSVSQTCTSSSSSIPLVQAKPCDKDRERCDVVILKNTREMLQRLKDTLRQRSDHFKSGSLVPDDKVKFGSPGWEERYYRTKFGAQTHQDIQNTRKDVVRKYGEGLCWILYNYYAGVCSWDWYYPYHYGPAVSDMKNLPFSSVSFRQGSSSSSKPFKPFDQLMAVLPPRSSGHALPESYRNLITCRESPLSGFYPTVVETDMDGKRFTWQAILKLPFINEGHLLAETQRLEKELQPDECRRNTVGFDRMYTSSSCVFGAEIKRRFEGSSQEDISIDSSTSAGINGFLTKIGADGDDPCAVDGVDDIEIEDDVVICVVYKNPRHHPHVPRLLNGVEVPAKTVTANDVVQGRRQLWHEHGGRGSSNYNYPPPLTRTSTSTSTSFHGNFGRATAGREI